MTCVAPENPQIFLCVGEGGGERAQRGGARNLPEVTGFEDRGRGHKFRNTGASRSWKRPGTESTLEPLEGTQPCQPRI